MKSRQILLTIFFSSILLYGEVETPLNTPVAKDKKEQIKEDKKKPKEVYDLKEISEKLKERLESKSPQIRELKNRKFLKGFYQQNNYQSLWIQSDGFGEKVFSLFNTIKGDITIFKSDKIYSDYIYILNHIENKKKTYRAY